MDQLFNALLGIWGMALEAAPWLTIGLLAAALIRAYVPTQIIGRWLGGRGVGSVMRASVVGIPLPLCSCGVLPTALELRRQGASRASTASFLVSTPEIGIDSFMLTLALLGPTMAAARPISAFFTALAAGLAALIVTRNMNDEPGRAFSPDTSTKTPATGGCCSPPAPASAEQIGDCCGGDSPPATTKAAPEPSCCGTQAEPEPEAVPSCCERESAAVATADGCSGDGEPDAEPDCCDASEPEPQPEPAGASCCSPQAPIAGGAAAVARPTHGQRIVGGLSYVFGKLWDDIKLWLGVAVVVAGLMMAFIDDNALAEWGTHPLAMVIMLIVGVPLYLCATASTPIAAGLLAVGVSPGAVLVFLLAGPATNIGSVVILKKELGLATVVAYLSAIAVCSVGAGLALNAIDAALSEPPAAVAAADEPEATPAQQHETHDHAAAPATTAAAAHENAAAEADEAHEHGHIFPTWFALLTVFWLLFVSIPPLRRLVFPRPATEAAASEPVAAAAACCENEPASDAPTRP